MFSNPRKTTENILEKKILTMQNHLAQLLIQVNQNKKLSTEEKAGYVY